MPGIFSVIAILIKQLTLLVSYVKNNAFPQPLTEEEEEKHLRLMAEGNDYSRNKLIEHNLRLVAHIEVVDTKLCSFAGQAGMFPHRTHVASVILMVRK